MHLDLTGIKIGVALTGSFCNLTMAFEAIETFVSAGADVTTIISHNVDDMDTRFHKAAEVKTNLVLLSGKPIIKSIVGAEPVGPKNMFDVLVVIPATGNTIAKLANAITDTPVLMAIKSHLRNKKPVVIGVSTNDGLGNNCSNIGRLMNMENIYFVPFSQDDPTGKEMSLVCHQDQVAATILAALNRKQVQPTLIG